MLIIDMRIYMLIQEIVFPLTLLVAAVSCFIFLFFFPKDNLSVFVIRSSLIGQI